MKKIWNIVKWLIVSCLAVLGLSLGIVLFFSVYRPTIQNADAIIVLGAALNTPALYNRALTGFGLYQEGKAPTLVLSGGRISSRYVSEASNMQHIIESTTETPPTPILEEESHTTYENIKNSKVKIPHAKSIIIVSDAFHLARAVLLAKREGFGPVYWAAPKASYYHFGEVSFYYMREMFAMIEYVPKFIKG